MPYKKNVPMSERGRLVRIERGSARETLANRGACGQTYNVVSLRWRTSRPRSDGGKSFLRHLFFKEH